MKGATSRRLARMRLVKITAYGGSFCIFSYFSVMKIFFLRIKDKDNKSTIKATKENERGN